MQAPAPQLQPQAAPASAAAALPDNGGACQQLQKSGYAVVEPALPIIGPGQCGTPLPVRLERIVLSNGASVQIKPPALVNCSFASVFSTWVHDELAPEAERQGQALTTIEEGGAYECRTRDRIAGAKLSEHSKGNALDIVALDSKNGRFFVVSQHPQTPFAIAMRATACNRFSTVLGPGADAYHSDNIHFDMEIRRKSGHFCQWNLPSK